MEKFKIGDLVTPVFGGPIMQVFDVEPGKPTTIGVQYWNGKKCKIQDLFDYQLTKVKRTLTMVNDVVEAKFELDPTEEERERFGLIKTTSTIFPPIYVELNKEFRFGPNEPQF